MKPGSTGRLAAAVVALLLGVGIATTASFAQKGKEPVPKTAQEREYVTLAQKHRPKNAQDEQKARGHMQLSRAARTKSRKGGAPDALDYTAYAVCFYAQLAGGASISEAGKDCRDQFLN